MRIVFNEVWPEGKCGSCEPSSLGDRAEAWLAWMDTIAKAV
jgi:hypothetical protein